MKKTIAIALAALTVCLAPVGASAHHGQRLGQGVCAGIQSGFHHGATCHRNLDLTTVVFSCVPPADGNGTGHCHVDADGDWICDDCGNSFGGAGHCSHADADGDGICDNCNTGWNCSHADADGDGICDNCSRAWGYVDADGDGVCDNWGSGSGNGGNGGGSGYGNGGGHHGGGHHGGRHHG